MPITPDPACDLLFGLLALQNGLIDQGQLVAAFQAWTREKSRPLADHLVARGNLDGDDRAAVEALVARHLKKYGGNAEHSLAAVSAGRSTRESLAMVGDADIEGALVRLCPTCTQPGEVADRTATYSVGASTSEGQRFRVLRPHAKGGLGAVFVALDSELHREVALKQILETHADDPTSRQRFLIEAEITGGLEHPGIVPVYGLGAYGDGRPYYTMRFIRGDSLKDAIEQFHLSSAHPGLLPAREGGRRPGEGASRDLQLRRLLRRFLDVCNAIEYAHSRGVLHRDIKPGNVIVGRHGETLVVDWGLAKAQGRAEVESLDERPLVPSSASGTAETLPGSALGTPAYMSPEQARGDLDRLCPQSDVYSLGATLYCLLTGKPPFVNDDLGAVLQAVQRGDFPSPRQLDPVLDRALEAICLKAMALKPGDRYPSPKALADDVERWMADEPVTAWREPVSRQARRWARRNRTAVTAAAMALIAGVVGLSAVAAVEARANAQLRQANRATSHALEATRKAQTETQTALGQSEESRKQAEAVSRFLVQAFRSPDPARDGRQVKVAEVIDQAGERLDKDVAVSHPTKGALLDALGRTYQGLGIFDKAEALHAKASALNEAALGPTHPQTLASRNNLANAYSSCGKTSEAIALHDSTLKALETTLGPDHPDTLQCRNDLAVDFWFAGQTDKAISLHRETLELRESKLGPDHPDTLQSRQNLAIALSTGRMSEAITMFQEVLRIQEKKLGPDHPFTMESRNDLAGAYRDAGRIPEATALDKETLRLRTANLGPDHPDTLTSRANLALDYHDAGRLSEAIVLGDETLRMRGLKLGPDHPDTLISRINLAEAYRDAGRPEAIPLNETTLERLRATLGPDHSHTLTCASNLAASYFQAGRLSESIAQFQSTIENCESKLGSEHSITLWNRGFLANAYEALNRWSEAEALIRDVLAVHRRTEKPDSPLMANDLAQLGRNLLEQSRWAAAEPLLRECLAICEKSQADDWKRFNAMSLLGGALLGQARFDEAEPFVVPGYEGMKQRKTKIVIPDKHLLREAEGRVVLLYESWGKTEQATEWKAKVGMPDLPSGVFVGR
jgi:serine/threonine protein kinase/tetratricopeptide (TPR) repeat protein